MVKCSLKVFHQTLTAFHPSIRALNNLSLCHRDKSNFTLGCLFGFCRLGCQLKPELGHDLRIVVLQGSADGLRVVAVVEQDRNLGKVDRLGSKVIQIVAQEFN